MLLLKQVMKRGLLVLGIALLVVAGIFMFSAPHSHAQSVCGGNGNACCANSTCSFGLTCTNATCIIPGTGSSSSNSGSGTSGTGSLQCAVTVPATGSFTFSFAASGGTVTASNPSPYLWEAEFPAANTTGSGSQFQTTFDAPGTY